MNWKRIESLLAIRLAGLLLFAGASLAQAQFQYTVNADNTITITGYTGAGGSVAIPAAINGLAVTSIGEGAFQFSTGLSNVAIASGITNIGNSAFQYCASLASVTIPGSVNSVGQEVFANCGNLTNVTMSNGVASVAELEFYECTSLANLVIPGSVKSIGFQAFDDCTSLTRVTISDGITNIGEYAFQLCTNLTSVTIPGSVTGIGDNGFTQCYSLTSVFFAGNAPTADSTVFSDDSSNPAMYYLPGTTGWSSPFASRQALLWNPVIQTSGTNFGVQSNQFGFNITGTAFIPIVVEACTNLADPAWTPLLTVTLTNGLLYYSEPLQSNLSGRYFRISSP